VLDEEIDLEVIVMKIGVFLPTWTYSMEGVTPSAKDVIEFGRSVEAIGFDSLWVPDHLYHEPYLDFRDHGYELPAEAQDLRSGFWESWSLLSALAAQTEQVEIGTMVTNTAFRNPAILAKTAATVDSLSNGRLVLGLGAGDFRSEHQFHGIPWERRIGRFEEALSIVVPMLNGERVTFDGEFYQAETLELEPRADRTGAIPVLIGSMLVGPRMQRLTMQYADGWTCWLAFEDSSLENFLARREKMRQACERFGRDPATLTSSVTVAVYAPDVTPAIPGQYPLTGSPDEVASELQRYVDAGTDHLVVNLQPMSQQGLEWVHDVVRRVTFPAHSIQ
jgi:probable F420-dependent oxidoreductase